MEHVDETGEKKKKSRLGNVLVRKSLVRIFTREVQQDKESASDIAAHWDRKKAEGSGSAWKKVLFKMRNQCIFYNGPCRVLALKMIVVK
jgi:hypothetical protein